MPTAAGAASRSSAAGAPRGKPTACCSRPRCSTRSAATPPTAGSPPSGSSASSRRSLERLGVERIDLYLAHDPDPDDAALGHGRQRSRSSRAAAGSAPGGSATTARTGSRRRSGYGQPALVQNSYSLLERGDEAEVLPLCGEHGIAYVPFGPLAGGWLTGRYRRGDPFPDGLADDAAPRAVREVPHRPDLRRARAARRRGGLAAASRWRRSRSPGCSPTPRQRRRLRALPPRSSRARARGARASLTPEERERIGSFFA